MPQTEDETQGVLDHLNRLLEEVRAKKAPAQRDLDILNAMFRSLFARSNSSMTLEQAKQLVAHFHELAEHTRNLGIPDPTHEELRPGVEALLNLPKPTLH